MPSAKPAPKPKAAPAKKPTAESKDVKIAPTAESATAASTGSKKAPQPLQLVRGMRDLLPNDQPHWQRVYEVFHRSAESYSFDRIDTPFVEETSLFVRGVGKVTDIVEKEMFSWETPGSESVSLRPEGTASVVRAYIQHGMLNLPQPIKLWYTGPMFRYERPQAGRFRQHFQGGFECIGESDAVIDAQLIIISYNILRELGLDPIVRINSLGSPESRVNYKTALVAFFVLKRTSCPKKIKSGCSRTHCAFLTPKIQRFKN